jgi:Ricin-type beta-trefoil lectin domain
MAIDDGNVPGTVDFDVDAERVLVRPYIGDYDYPDAAHELGASRGYRPPRVLQLAPRARRTSAPARGRHRGHRSDVPAVHRATALGGGRRPVLLAVSAAAALLALAVGLVIAGTGGRLAAPGSRQAEVPGAVGGLEPSVPGQPGDAMPPGTASGDPTDPGGPARPGDPDVVPLTSVLAPAPGPGTSPDGRPWPTGPGRTPSPAARTPTGRPSPTPPPVLGTTGEIINMNGLCLDGTTAGDRVRLWDCTGTPSQQWTVAGDGTLRVMGSCAEPGVGLVRLEACDGDPAQQWRTGSAGSLVNPASASCLGDPRSGTSSKGMPQRTAPCDQSDAQRWWLPGLG